MHYVLTILACGLCVSVASPALAGAVVVPVAEPGSLSLLAAAGAIGVLWHRSRNRE